MLDKLDRELGFQQTALSLLNKRQDILASNVANADTPGYLARDIDFSSQLKAAVSRNGTQGPLSLTLTSGQHIAAKAPSVNDPGLLYRIPDQPSVDGNTVDMDRERASFVDNSVKYQSGLTILGAQIKNMMSAINQG
ncbi:flagellar basal body rod protein FlgB [Pantoea anthophila]|uniref:flagellar basal body rod protein FlgB n=1 Tax=Pantoea anthophila TaxID=470931 RepID=UPI0027845A6D|nr:flagellar basal body rod protein FlgB [Pantoea anthophila]MDQ1213480.1 flagellar basal-body rod protein FlgB [Pantoea anthophila]